MLKRKELIIKNTYNNFNNYIYDINNFKLNLIGKSNSILCLKKQIYFPSIR